MLLLALQRVGNITCMPMEMLQRSPACSVALLDLFLFFVAWQWALIRYSEYSSENVFLVDYFLRLAGNSLFLWVVFK